MRSRISFTHNFNLIFRRISVRSQLWHRGHVVTPSFGTNNVGELPRFLFLRNPCIGVESGTKYSQNTVDHLDCMWIAFGVLLTVSSIRNSFKILTSFQASNFKHFIEVGCASYPWTLNLRRAKSTGGCGLCLWYSNFWPFFQDILLQTYSSLQLVRFARKFRSDEGP